MSLANGAVILPAVQEIIFDKDLKVPLAGGVVTFYSDNNRTSGPPTPGFKNVYALTGTGPGTYNYVSLGYQLTLSSIGTFLDLSGNNCVPYLWPYEGSPNDNPPSTVVDNYYIVVVSSTNVPQFTVQNWPGIEAPASPINTASTTDNIISNPEFCNVLFSQAATSIAPVVFSTSGANVVTSVAPNWDIITNGTGSFSVYQAEISSISSGTNPNYGLAITASSGYSSPLILRQRLTNTARIFAGNTVSATMTIQTLDGSTPIVTMNYVPSLTMIAQSICSGALSNTGFTVLSGNALITASTVGSVPSAYVDIDISIPVSHAMLISAIQVCGTSNINETVAYLQEPTFRQIDHLFHYYQPQLNFKPIPSLLVGWDFGLNPAQFGSTQTVTTTPAYAWDQTIMASAVNNVNVIRFVSGFGALSAVTTGNADAFYMLQYLSGPQAIQTCLTNLSVNIQAYSLVNSGVSVNVYLFNGNTSSTIPTLPTTIGTIDNTGAFTLTAANWTAIPLANGNSNTAVLPLSDLNNIGFPTFLSDGAFYTAGTGNFAIVVTFTVPTSATQVIVNSISCVPGDIPTRPAPQTADEVLRECQYYWRSSFLRGVAPVQNAGANTGEFYALQAIANNTLNSFPIRFPFPMRTTPVNPPIFYNPVAANGFIYNFDSANPFSSTALKANTLTANGFIVNGTAPPGSLAGDDIGIHYSVNARLGDV